jgi:hypothetical protein
MIGEYSERGIENTPGISFTDLRFRLDGAGHES